MQALVIRCDSGAQLGNAQGHGVTQLVDMQSGGRGGTNRFGSAHAGLARRQVHQIAVAALALRGGQPDIHHMEWWDAGAQCHGGVHDVLSTSDSS